MTMATSDERVDEILASAAEAFLELEAMPDRERADILRSIADALDANASALVATAESETHLGEARLAGELRRTTFQLRFFADIIADSGHRGVRIDTADPDWPMGAPRPDIRRRLEPLGPVLVFSASNFPFAFSVAGGDTASALAAGCPVVVKAHSGHPQLSVATADVIKGAIAGRAPAGTFDLIVGTEAGRRAIVDSRIAAVGFTGSIEGGRALFDLAVSRPSPIPFYGELGSVNPVIVTERAAAERADDIVEGFIGSFTVGAGQFCTKPGVLLVPKASDLTEKLASKTLPAGSPLLNERIAAGYRENLAAVAARPGVRPLAGELPDEGELAPAPTLVVTDIDTVLADFHSVVQECFGPAAVVVEYDDASQLRAFAEAVEGQLTAGLFAEPADEVQDLVRLLARRAGRVLWNQWPTGVSVTYAQQHGGPYPASTASTTTSVGATAIERFLRPVAYQGFPAELLPAELRDA